jgi:hypothetical protein
MQVPTTGKKGVQSCFKIISIRMQGLADNSKNSGENGG